ncbi:hypothetical protein P152DRAFT_403061 [Eremomyces bilateralis CBS 781.70]|uniref:Azaphilone pigments biosynthesis cluster protein L N-terminal domain-containing protein n=1 Tax=Eremomyces bilateralis CBS 781.70 TaxID=1392243 RepID=A0A6G1FUM5_9PEZI|nr:uncharacterized protein P152DRAFT_403061 [Eremomyces bilateralis CBS 781.70]KAF1809595.1 hypothetical protein P152DRAFT_403061 [Eremomyces bilateralis CBS 781.70]
MAEPISLASGLITFVVFALKTSTSLYEAVDSFKTSQRAIRELRSELSGLQAVLLSLQEAASNSTVKLDVLQVPLQRCGKACQEFEEVIAKCTAHSGGSRESFRDWAKIRYMGNTIEGFRRTLEVYKSTITIALGDANIRTSVVTVEVLQEYRQLIDDTVSDLRDHLQEINNKLESLTSQGPSLSIEDSNEVQRIQEEKESTQQCLLICADVAAHVDNTRPKVLENLSTPDDGYQSLMNTSRAQVSARAATAKTLQDCGRMLHSTTSKLEKYLREIENRLDTMDSTAIRPSQHQISEEASIREERDSIQKCIEIVGNASDQADQTRTNEFEDITMADDGHQVIVSTLGDLISARRITVGNRSIQWLGQMSDESLQKLSGDHRHFVPEKFERAQSGIVAEFGDRHGPGRKLEPDARSGANPVTAKERLT